MLPSGSQIIVIGGGFYGCSIAAFLAQKGATVTLIEQESELMQRASYHNQARLHGGYHYPRSFRTAYRSRLNFRRFYEDFKPAIVTNFTSLYAIARLNSKVSASQFETFCRQIDAPLCLARPALTKLFSKRLITSVYEAEEYVFDAIIMRQLMHTRLQQLAVKICLDTTVTAISAGSKGVFSVELNSKALDLQPSLSAAYIINCTYSGLHSIQGINTVGFPLKHEITELALVQLPLELQNLAVTVMDGPFFSFMPFPDRLSTFSHVRYTPHAAWQGNVNTLFNPYLALDRFKKTSNFNFMLRDAMRFIPCLEDTCYVDSLFEIKTLLSQHEGDDGRPILFEPALHHPQILSVLGAKIDNIYDALMALELHFSEK